MIQRISAKQARNNFSELLGRVCYGRDIIIVEKQKKPMVAIIPADQLENHMKIRRKSFQLLEQFRSKLPDVPDQEIETDISEAITSIRNQND